MLGIMKILNFLCVGFFAMACLSGASNAQEALTPQQKTAIEALIRDTIRNNPEILVEALKKLEAREQQAEEEKVREVLKLERAALVRGTADLTSGNSKGDVTIVEFFDYRCGYCKQVTPQLEAALKADSKIRVVFKEFPILGPDSKIATRAALAARKQNKYSELHDALMSAKGALNEAQIFQIAADVGLDIKKLRSDMTDPAIETLIRANYELAEKLGIRGTPAFIIGDRLIPGAISQQQINALVEEARHSCASC